MTRRLALIVAALALASCGKHPVTPASPSTPSSASLSMQLESPAYVFRYAPGDRIDAAWQDGFNAWAVAALDVTPHARVTYNKYLTRTHMGDLTGRYNTNGYAEPALSTIHTIWPTDNHEVVHVYSALFGTPTALFNEGIAVAHQTNPARGDFTARWKDGTAVHEWARRFKRQGSLPPLASLLATSDFRQLDPDVTYPVAGSFVRYLLDGYGLERLKMFFRDGSPTDDATLVRERFASVYGLSIEDAEREWQALVDSLE